MIKFLSELAKLVILLFGVWVMVNKIPNRSDLTDAITPLRIEITSTLIKVDSLSVEIARHEANSKLHRR